MSVSINKSGNNTAFETSIQRIGRMISEQYGIRIIFEGNRIYTDGTNIILPAMPADLTHEEKMNVNTLLDHQVGHVRFSDGSVLYQGETKFHQDLLMMAEDIRVEALMMEDFPGTITSFERLNSQLRDGLITRWNHLPMAARLVAGIRDAILGRSTVNDPVLQQALLTVIAEIKAIPECGTTQEIKKITDRMAERLKYLVLYEPPEVFDPENNQVDEKGDPVPEPEPESKDLDEGEEAGNGAEKKESKKKDGKEQAKEKAKKDGDKSKKSKEKGEKSEDDSTDEAEQGETQDGEEQGGGEEQDGQGEGEEQDGKEQGEGQGQPGGEGESGEGEAQDGDEQDGQGEGDEESETQEEGRKGGQSGGRIKGVRPGSGVGENAETSKGETVDQDDVNKGSSMGGGKLMDLPTDVESLVNRQVQARAKVKEEAKDDHGQTPMLASSTRFDLVHDHSKIRERLKYAELYNRVSHLVQPVKRAIERALIVKENVRWSTEKERGSLNSKALTGLVVQPGYRTPFKVRERNDTRSIAVGIAVDLSGSYCAVCGHRSCDFAERAGGEQLILGRDAAMAMAQALMELEIPCEVTGFTCISESRMPKGKATTHLRWTERLDLHIFKDIESDRLDGITKIEAGKGNPTGEALMWAAKRLAGHRAKRKIMLVLSNGSPTLADQPKEAAERHLSKIIKQVTDSGIEVIGVGIQDNQVSKLFPTAIEIEKIDDLPGTCLQSLQKILLAGGNQVSRGVAGSSLRGQTRVI